MQEFHRYFMLLALSVQQRSTCKRRKVGALLVKDNRVISSGYNGTPDGMTNCDEGGCVRCSSAEEKYRSGNAYDKCICVHAEQNALITAARFGNSIENSVLYTTLEPCFTCAKEVLQGKIQAVYYLEQLGLQEDKELQHQAKIIKNRFENSPKRIHPTDLIPLIEAMKTDILDILNRRSHVEQPAGTTEFKMPI